MPARSSRARVRHTLGSMTPLQQRIRSCRISVTRQGATHVGARSYRTARPDRRRDREGREAAVVDCIADLPQRGGVLVLGRLGRRRGPEAIPVYRLIVISYVL